MKEVFFIIRIDQSFEIFSVLFRIRDFDSLSCELGNFIFKVLH